ncbi:hypothetical protein ACYCCF_30040 [Streptomyces argenteolus]|uniref:hypothetical protein n=1 Tax=Streptomyces sp. NPDC025273 TaxID=3155251 RepID=UPI0033C3F922
MNEQLAYRRARDLQGAACSTTADLGRYLAQIRMDAHSLRIGLAQAVVHAYAGTTLPDHGTAELPYPQDVVERDLFDDVMGRGDPDSVDCTPRHLVRDPALAKALRHTLRLLEDTADAAGLVSDLLPRSRSVHPQAGTALPPW